MLLLSIFEQLALLLIYGPPLNPFSVLQMSFQHNSRELDFGSLGFDEKRELYFTLRNNNPVNVRNISLQFLAWVSFCFNTYSTVYPMITPILYLGG